MSNRTRHINSNGYIDCGSFLHARQYSTRVHGFAIDTLERIVIANNALDLLLYQFTPRNLGLGQVLDHALDGSRNLTSTSSRGTLDHGFFDLIADALGVFL